MSIEITTAAKSAVPANKATAPAAAKSIPRALDETDAVVVRKLMFRESIDVPGEQGIRSVAGTDRPGKPHYRILWLPRVNVYLVRASELRGPDNRQPTHTFMVPHAWAIAEIDPT